MSSFGINARRKSSNRSKKSKPFGKLTIDTKFASQGRTFPYESRVQELSFVSFEESKARKNAFASKPNLKQQFENRLPVLAGPRRGVPVVGNDAPEPARSIAGDIVAPTSDTDRSDPMHPLHKRVKGLRPTPLDLTQDISPSDQAITIGISLPSSSVSQHTWSPQQEHIPGTQQQHEGDRYRYGQDVSTPIIVITPARDNFDLPDLAPRRPASSVYSRYTNCYPKSQHEQRTPPVPPLPLFTDTNCPKSKWSMSTAPPRASGLTTFEEDFPSALQRDTRLLPSSPAIRSTERNIPSRSLSKASTAGLPTPRRSKGWWNVITSPFSAKSAASHFWKSPRLEDAADRVPILEDQATMGASDAHAGVIFTNRAPDDDELRSAPPSQYETTLDEKLMSLKRSDTAPAALDPNVPGVNIYRVPSTGEAAAYYNPHKNFPSLCLESFSRSIDDLAGWSPSQSVFIPDRHSQQHLGGIARGSPVETAHDMANDHAKEHERMSAASRPSGGIPVGATIFSSPTEDELASAGLSRPTPPRNMTQATIDSTLSPLSATPTVQDAHMARFVGPHSSHGEPRKVEVSPAPTPSHYGLGFATLGAATISHRTSAYDVSKKPAVTEKSSPTAGHTRQDSYGLGISEGERELFPPPKALSEKPRLGTDRFGQLRVRSLDEDETPTRPWFRRFFWAIAAAFGGLIMLLIICLVIFVPQKHNDVPVEASWVNTTGFPPLPAGISTVIQPRNTESRDSCVSTPSAWSCASPYGVADSLPNFRFEIRFRNGSLPSNETQTANSRRWQDASALHQFVRRSSWSEYLFSASPTPPKEDDQIFLGQTTDNVSVPYNGEETPFYMSLLNPVQLSQATSKHKRSGNFTYPYPDNQNDSNDSDSSSSAATDAPNEIPPPATRPNGQPTEAQLYPYTTAQPLRLFDRGLDTEHYSFYNYYDRTIYMSGLSASSTGNGSNASGNAALQNASAVCTFSQTRFLVQIWTRKGSVAALNNTSTDDVVAGNSTANDFTAPGSFPYPVTVTIDRHGGKAASKGAYCYQLDEQHQVMGEARWWMEEDRGAGGSLIYAADVPGTNHTKRGDDDEPASGGIDGGSGGCNCKWQNWK